ncbi:hypothetical protein [Sinorhizobium fredii]|uniref:hypothetical protein n=1 Tax=Rhizobium fredii TaxID=380 RepID=UPI0009B70AA1|nr:hypothetical protein [Sinorhizobium fredii]WOS61371.1 hypothetical protein SFGR64A_10390 [Sinorhizobium fredii GR64]
MAFFAAMSAPSKTKLRTVTVPNPYYSRAHPADATNPPTIPAVINVRESAVTTLATRGVLDAAQVAAANRFRLLYEAMGGKGAGAIDCGREHVDGGKAREPITERQLGAGQELARCRALLGVRLYRLVSAVAGEGRSLHEVAGHNKRARLVAADCLRWALDDLAAMWRLATRR